MTRANLVSDTHTPETHPARQGFSIDTKRGLRGKNLAKVLDFAEAYWRQNYPDT